MQVIDFIQGDVTGNGCMEQISLMGEKAFGDYTGLSKKMKLKIADYTGKELFLINLPNASGYGARVFKGDFTGDGIDEVLVTIYSGASGGYTYNYLYGFATGKSKLLFDSTIYNENYDGLVQFADGYKVIIQTEEMGKKYSLDISLKDKAYLQMIYDECGKLKKPMEGEILGIIAVNPEDFNNDGIYTLSTIQQIAGIHGRDMLGLLETYFKWDEGMGKFRPFMEYVSVIGEIL